MEYYIILGKKCNLNCKYCYRKKGDSFEDRPSPDLIESAIKFIFSGSDQNIIIVFHGGEPLLFQKTIKEFMHKVGEKDNLIYNLYTNGTLLNEIDRSILKKVNYITISIDGEEEIHNKYRGKGTYSLIFNNLRSIRPLFTGHIMGRITLAIDKRASLLKAVMGILNSNLFDSVTWQIQNTSQHYNSEITSDFLNNYKEELFKLINYWFENLKNNKKLNILPIQAIIRSRLFNEEHKGFRCGCGSNLVFIDLTNGGQCYACDELLDAEQFKIGDLNNGIKIPTTLNHIFLRKQCSTCELKYICGGRCLHSCLFPDDRFNFYCETVKAFVNFIDHILPKINQLINNKNLHFEDIYCSACDLIEEIP